MTQPTIYVIEASGKDIQSFINTRLIPAIDGQPSELSVLSMLTLAILVMKPDIEVEILRRTVMDVSGYMISLLDTPTLSSNDKEEGHQKVVMN